MSVSKQRMSELEGRAFERRLESLLSDAGVLFKVPTLRSVKGRHTGRAWLDYAGCLPGGRMVTFDAKWVGKRGRVVPSVLSAFQRECAEAAWQAGAAVLVLVGRAHGGALPVHAVRWEDLREGGVDLDDVATVESWAGLVEVCG